MKLFRNMTIIVLLLLIGLFTAFNLKLTYNIAYETHELYRWHFEDDYYGGDIPQWGQQ
jgi:hypothetical protein